MDTTSRDVRPGATLRTFLIADVRGYTKFTAAHGDAVAARLAKKFADLARDAVEARGGRVIELRGDEALAVFEDTAQAVRAALDFQLTCAEETAADDELPLPVGIGIDAGEAVPVEDGFRGVALNMAARLCSNAKAGQVIVTRNVATIVGSGNGLSFEARGSVELKGFEKPQELVEAIARGVGPRDLGVISQESTMPIELDATTPLVGREHEMHWLRGTWRQARRGTGRLMFVTGGAQMGKTRLAAEIAAEVTALGGDVEYVGAGGAGPALAVGAISRVAQAATPAILVVNDVEALGDDVARVISDATSSIARVPALVLVLVRDADTLPALSTAITDANARGDGLIKLGPLDANGVAEIVRLYAGDAVVDAPLESIARSSGGVPGRVHEVASEWARDEAGRRLVAAAEFISEGRARRGAGLDFANNVINLRLGRMYGTETVTEIDECPYKGLAPFDEVDAAYFFGRERLVGELAARTVGVGLLGVIGASGSGKSSVVRAGLVPSLHADLLPGSARWRAVVMRPGDDPAGALRVALGGLTLEAAVDRTDPSERLVLIVDQFEEVFTLVEDDDARATFLDEIATVIERPDRAIVVLVMRDDFYGKCAPYEQLARALSANHVLVAPMGRDELRRAIELPARRARLHVEAALVDALIGEAADEPGSLPLLSTAMAELWAARSDGWMRMESCVETGGLRGAIARLAEESFARLSPPEQEAARAMLLRLTGSGEGDTVTRRRASLDEFDLGRHPDAKAVLDRFTQDRLLTMSEGSVEVAHEALLREWPRLREWLDEDVQGRLLRLHLTEAAKQWDASGREVGELYRGARLSSALDWTTLHGRELNELEQLFVTESRQASEHEIERQRRTNRRLRGLLSGVAVFLVLALIAGVLAVVQRSTARKNATAETAQRLGAQALVQNDLDLSLLLAREGVNISDTTATRGYLLAALLRSPAALGVLRPLPGRELGVAVFDGGKRLLVLNNGNVAGVIDLATRKLVGSVPNVIIDQPTVDGRGVLIVTSSGDVSLYDTNLRLIRKIGSAPDDFVHPSPTNLNTAQQTASPDGQSLAFAPSTNSGAVVASLASGKRTTYKTAPGLIGQTAFSSDGRYLLTGVAQGNTSVTQVWRVGDPSRPVRTISTPALSCLAILSLDDKKLACGGLDGSVWIYDMSSGHGSQVHGRHNAGVDRLTFSPDRRTLVTTGDDSQVLVWDVQSGALTETLHGHNGRIPQAAYSPDGTTIYTASLDGSIMIWDVSGKHRLGNVYRVDGGGTDFIQSMVAESPDGKLLAFPSTTGEVVIRDAADLSLVRAINTGSGLPIAAAFSPDSQKIAINVHTFLGRDINGPCNGYRAAVWDVRTGATVADLQGPAIPKDPNDFHRCGDFETLAWSPDGRTIAGGFDGFPPTRGTVWFWSFPGGGQAQRHFEVPPDAKGGSNGIGGLLYSPDGRHLAVAWGESASLYGADGSKPSFTVNVDNGYGRSKALAFSPDGKILSTGGGDGYAQFWDTVTGKRTGRSVLANACWIDSLEFNGAGTQLLASGCDGSARLIDVSTRNTIGAPFQGPGNVHNSAVFSVGYRFIDVAYTDGTMLRWDIEPSAWRARACEVAGRNLTRDEWARFLPERPYGTVCPGL